MRIEGGNIPITLDTLKAIRLVQPIRTAHGTRFRVIGVPTPLLRFFPLHPYQPVVPSRPHRLNLSLALSHRRHMYHFTGSG